MGRAVFAGICGFKPVTASACHPRSLRLTVEFLCHGKSQGRAELV